MALPELIGTYKEYKAKTKALLYWLTRTADTCCDLGGILPSLQRRRASKTPGLSPPQDTDTSRQSAAAESEVTTTELVKLAEAIAKAVPPVPVPAGVLLIIKDVIAKRQTSAQWYSAQALKGDSKVAVENESHRYFILVLRRILDILSPSVEAESTTEPIQEASHQSKKKSKKSKTKHDGVRNLFEGLHIQEPSVNPLGQDSHHSISAAAADLVDVEFQLKEDDSAFETWCFLQDLKDMRMYVKHSWEDYFKGEISFLAVSSITDAAINLLCRASDDFDSPFGSKDWLDLLDYLGIGYFVRGSAIWLHPHPDRKTEDPRMPDPGVNVVDLLCPIAFECLQSWKIDVDTFCRLEKLCKEPGDTRDIKGCDKHRFHPACGLLFRLLKEIHPLGCHIKDFAADDFVRGLADIHTKSRIPVWMVVACQMLLDTTDAVGLCVQQGVHQVREKFALVKEMSLALGDYKKQSSRKLLDVKGATTYLHNLLVQVSRVEKVIRLPSEHRHWTGDIPFKESTLPGTAGEMLTDLSVAVYEIGCSIARHGDFILSVAHLYKGLRAMGALAETWVDMEFVLSCFGSDDNKSAMVAKEGQEWDGERRDRAVRHYQLALGVPARIIVARMKEGASETKLLRTGEPRGVRILSPLLQGLCERLPQQRTHGLGCARTKILETVLHALAARDTPSNTGKAPQSGSHLRTSFKGPQLLEAMRKQWIRDEPTLHFDFTSFMLSCARLLDKVASQPGLIQRFRHTDSTDDHTVMIQNILRCSAHLPAVSSTADILRSHIETFGKTFTNKANSQSSNRIPKGLRPSIENIHEASSAFDATGCCILEYANAHYSISGVTLAAYHPGVVPEVTSDMTDRESNVSGGETDPDNVVDLAAQAFGFGSVFPKAITEEAMRNIAKDNRKWLASRSRLLQWYIEKHKAGTVDDDELRVLAQETAGHPLIKLKTQDVKDGEIDGQSAVREEWCYQVRKGEDRFQHYLRVTAEVMGSQRKLYEGTAGQIWVPWPLEAYLSYLKGEVEASDAVKASIERCAHAGFHMILAEFKKRFTDTDYRVVCTILERRDDSSKFESRSA